MGSINKGEEESTTTPDTSIPRQIADSVLSSRSALEGERKQVTVLFCDVAGFTPLSEKLDPEEVSDLLRPALDIMASEVHAYEGTVGQFTGDGLMALFGAPLAHEDDPQRAIYAALAMQGRLEKYGEKLKPKGIGLSVRIGINTGLVMVGSVGDDLSMEYTAIGDTVNLASRLESAAEPGTIQISESTYRLIQGYFDFSDLGETFVKGKEEPVHAYRVLGALPTQTRISASLSRGISPFVGREMELDLLSRYYQQVKEGSGQVVGMVGEPGAGKSRLLLQFRELLPEGEYTYLEGGCIHYGEAIAYLPILDILRDYFNITEGENEDESKKKFEGRLASWDSRLQDIFPPLQELLSLQVEDQEYLSLDPAQRRERAFEAIHYLFLAESQTRPLILAVEDLHWVDKTSEEFLSYLIEGLPAASILLLLLYRPEYLSAWTSKTYYNQIRVDHLAQRPSTELVEAILAGGEVSPELSGFIVARTAGNPLFIEELTRGLLEAGSILKDDGRYVLSSTPSAIQIPDTIQGIISSRLDRLPEEAKETLQVAAVIGREFSLRLLQEVTGSSKPLKSYLLQLQSLEFIYGKSLFPEPEYIFKHALTQEVAYSSLLLKRRREIHGRVGQAIEKLYGGALEDFYETLAHHYSRSEDTEKALCYLKLSGDKAARGYHNWEAVRFYQEALQVLDGQPEGEENKHEKMAVYLSMLNPLTLLGFPESSFQILQEAEKLAAELGDDASLVTVYGKLSRYHSFKGDSSLGLEYSEKCFDAAERFGDVKNIAMIAIDICSAMNFAGRILELAVFSRRVLEFLEEQHKEEDLFAGGLNAFASQCGWCGLALTWLGEFEEGKAVLDKGLKLAPQIDDAYGIGWVEYSYSFLALCEGDADTTIDHAHKAIERFEEAGVELILGGALTLLGSGYYLLGDFETARAHAERGLEIQRRSGAPILVPLMCHILALIRAAAGDLDGGMESAREALKLSREFGVRTFEPFALQTLGRIAGEADPVQVKVAEGYIQQGISLSEEMRMKLGLGYGYLFLGEVFEIADRRQEALENLRKAEEMYREMGVVPDSYWLTRTREALARLEPLS